MKSLAAPTQRVLSALAVALVLVLTGCTADSLTGPDLSPTLQADVEVVAPATSPDVLFDGGVGGDHNEGQAYGGVGGDHNEGQAYGGVGGDHNEGQAAGRAFSGGLGDHNEGAANKCGGVGGDHNEGC